MEIGAFHPVHLTFPEAFLRMGGALALSLCLGLERFLRKKPIDFRPFVIISVASCALAIGIIEFAYGTDDETMSIDPGRVLSGVMSGIGFLGAGALFREDKTVHGAGSAASIWASGAIGLICGLGFLWLAGILALTLVVVLLVSRPFTEDYTININDEK